jgi:hypothetical protein
LLLWVQGPKAIVNDVAAAVPVFLKFTVVTELLVVPVAFDGTSVVLPPYLLNDVHVEEFVLMPPVLSVLLHTVVPEVPDSCRTTVPVAAVFCELVMVATNADSVLVIARARTTAPMRPAATMSWMKRRCLFDSFAELSDTWSLSGVVGTPWSRGVRREVKATRRRRH